MSGADIDAGRHEQGGHRAVLRSETIAALQLSPEGRYVDATYGRGGHSALLLHGLNDQGRLLAVDRDPAAIADARIRFADDSRVTVVQANFASLARVVAEQQWTGQVTGLVLDLGVSSPQLDEAERGFSFGRDGDLDMRMDPASGVTAAEWLGRVGENDLMNVLKEYGEERYAGRIARAIIEARAVAPLRRTQQLAEIIKAAHPRWERHQHPATRSFQAIRIHVNGELDALRTVLNQAADLLQPGGRIAVISFHSLEDRIVKHMLRKPPLNPNYPRHLPLPEAADTHPWRLIGKAIKASAEEVKANPRARSAVLRVAERVDVAA